MTPDAPLFEEVTQVGIVVRDLKSALAEYTDRGCPWRILMEGNFVGARFAYLDTEGPLKTIIEIRGTPERTGRALSPTGGTLLCRRDCRIIAPNFKGLRYDSTQ